MTLLHIVPDFTFANTYHGTYKDVISRVRWFEANAESYRQVRVPLGSDGAAWASTLPSDAPSAIFVEYTRFPRLLRDLRRRYPGARLATRAINAEPLQHLDNYGWFPSKGPIWMLYAMARLLWNDTRSRLFSDVIFSINDWENRVYWNRLPGRAPVEWLPYYCPDHLVPTHSPPCQERRTIACLPTSQKNRKSWDLVMRFFNFASAMQAAGSDSYFVVTGDLDGWGLPDCAAVQRAGMVKDLASFLASVRAVCVLSPLGYGFKTTMGDALAANAQVIAHPKLLRRCPSDVRDVALPLDSHNFQAVDVLSWLAEGVTQDGRSAYADARERNHVLLAHWVSGEGMTT